MYLVGKVSNGDVSGRGNIRWGCVWSGKCPSGKYPSGKCPDTLDDMFFLDSDSPKSLVGEISVGEVSVGDVSRRRSVYQGCVSGWGNVCRGSARRGNVRTS